MILVDTNILSTFGKVVSYAINSIWEKIEALEGRVLWWLKVLRMLLRRLRG